VARLVKVKTPILRRRTLQMLLRTAYPFPFSPTQTSNLLFLIKDTSKPRQNRYTVISMPPKHGRGVPANPRATRSTLNLTSKTTGGIINEFENARSSLLQKLSLLSSSTQSSNSSSPLILMGPSRSRSSADNRCQGFCKRVVSFARLASRCTTTTKISALLSPASTPTVLRNGQSKSPRTTYATSAVSRSTFALHSTTTCYSQWSTRREAD
jgi:hypothetical protein